MYICEREKERERERQRERKRRSVCVNNYKLVLHTYNKHQLIVNRCTILTA